MPGAKCETCKFFDNQPPSELGRGQRAELYGYCRRHPPFVIQQLMVGSQPSKAQTVWPVVGKSQWCGEYKVE
jgi:hypothetical protein